MQLIHMVNCGRMRGQQIVALEQLAAQNDYWIEQGWENNSKNPNSGWLIIISFITQFINICTILKQVT